MGDAAETDRQRLGRLVGQRRQALGLSLSEAARQAGVNRATWTGIEQRGTEAEDYTLARVEQVIGWKPGSVQAVLAGGEPVESPQPGRPERVRTGPTDYIGLWEEEILDEIWSNPSLPEAVKEELTARARAKAAEARVIEDRLRRTA